jgi:hypothetical protein
MLNGKKQAIEAEVEQLSKGRAELQGSLTDAIRASLVEMTKALENMRKAGSSTAPAEGEGKE